MKRTRSYAFIGVTEVTVRGVCVIPPDWQLLPRHVEKNVKGVSTEVVMKKRLIMIQNFNFSKFRFVLELF